MLQMFLPMAEFDVFLSVAAQHKIVNLRGGQEPMIGSCGGIFNHSSLFDSLPWLAVCRAPRVVKTCSVHVTRNA